MWLCWASGASGVPVSTCDQFPFMDSKPFKNLGQTNSFPFSDSPNYPSEPQGRSTNPPTPSHLFLQGLETRWHSLRFTFLTQATTRWPFQTFIMMQSEHPKKAVLVDSIGRKHLAAQWSRTTHTAPRRASRTSGRPHRDSFKHKTSSCPGHSNRRCRWLPRASLCGSLRSGKHLKLWLPVALSGNPFCFPTKLLFQDLGVLAHSCR